MDDETQQPTPFEIEIETMAYGGSGMGRHNGKVIFVPYTIPGETLSARMVDERERIGFAEGVTLVDSSLDRTLPTCAHFGPKRCAGCQWQHMVYDAQRLIKQDVLADQLERVGGITDDIVRSVIASPQEWHYRWQMRFVGTSEGKLGMSTTDGGAMTIEACIVLHPDLQALHDQLDIDMTPFSQVKLMRGSDGALMVLLYALEEEAPELELDINASINLVLPDNEPLNLAGNTHLTYDIKGRSFRVTAGSAFRDHVEMIPALVDAVLEAVGDAKSVIDLYAGVGLFGAFVADKADYVTLVESYPPAATDADENTSDLEHVDLIEGRVEDVLEAAEAYDAAIVNPTSHGLSVEAIDGLVELGVKTIVYVSSDAATLSRDAKRLTRQGYELEYVQPFDVAPQTYYLEMVAKFVKSKKRNKKRKGA